MNSARVQPPPVPPLPAAGLAWWQWLLAAALLLVAGSGLLVWQALTPDREVRVLRDAIRTVGGISSESSFQLSVGTLPMVVGRLGARFLPVPPEARVALRTLRGASVGVYPASKQARGPALLEAADRSLVRRGWERVVGVVDGGDVVGVYLPQDLSSPKRIRVAVFVQSGDHLVVVTARANLDPLLAWIREQTGQGGRFLPDAPIAFR